MIMGTETFDGERIEGYQVKTTFFAQHQAESLDRKQTALDALRSEAPDRSETELRTLLGAFFIPRGTMCSSPSVCSAVASEVA